MDESDSSTLRGPKVEKGIRRRQGQRLTGEEKAQAQDRFLEVFGQTANVTLSCRAVGIDRSAVYRWKDANGTFGKRWAIANEEANDLLEAEAHRRAVQGVTREKSIYYHGEEVGTESVTEYSDALLMFLLKARMPHKYREMRRLEHTGAEGRPDIPLALLDKIFREADLDGDED